MIQEKHIAYSSKVIFLTFTVLPVALGFGYAFFYSIGVVGKLNEGFTLTHWEQVLWSKEVWQSLGLSLWIAIASVITAVGLALFLMLFFKQYLQKGLLATAIYFPLALPPVVMAFLGFMWFSGSGWFSRILVQAGILKSMDAFPTLINDTYGAGIILVTVFLITPFFIILYSGLYRSEKLEAYANVAKNLGASSKTVLMKVTIPILVKKSLFTIVLFVVFVMGSYEVPLLLGSQHPQMISVFTVNKLQRFNLSDIPQAYVFACVYGVLVISIVTAFLVKRIKKSTV